jgi:hypothetical protein
MENKRCLRFVIYLIDLRIQLYLSTLKYMNYIKAFNQVDEYALVDLLSFKYNCTIDRFQLRILVALYFEYDGDLRSSLEEFFENLVAKFKDLIGNDLNVSNFLNSARSSWNEILSVCVALSHADEGGMNGWAIIAEQLYRAEFASAGIKYDYNAAVASTSFRGFFGDPEEYRRYGKLLEDLHY